MDVFMLIAAFGGGLFGAAISAVGSLVLVGILAIVGGALGLAGQGGFVLDNFAFGSYIGPHIALAGGVAAAAFAGKRKKIASGMDVAKPLHSLNDPLVLVVGGVFGVIGFLVVYLLGGVLALRADNVAITIVISGLITRLAFGKGGPLGKFEAVPANPKAKRQWFPAGAGLVQCVVLGLGVGLVVAGVGIHLLSVIDGALVTAFFPFICFGIAAFTLVFAVMGHGIPATHHIALPAALAATLAAVAHGNITGLIIGAAVGVICSILGDVAGKAFNSHTNTFIDPPAVVLAVVVAVILAVLG